MEFEAFFRKKIGLAYCTFHGPIKIQTYDGVYAKGAEFLVRRVPLGVLHNWVLIQLKDTPHIFENVQCLIR